MAGVTGGRTGKNLVWSLLPLAVVIALVAGLGGMCSFNPGGGTGSSDRVITAPVDAPAELARVARAVPFAVRSPAVPGDWRANSFGHRRVTEVPSGPRAVRVGWLLPAGGYLRLSQSDATELDLVRLETEQRRPAPVGAAQVAGVTWVHYPSVQGELAWVADVDGVRLLVTGSASQPQFQVLAEAVLAAPQL